MKKYALDNGNTYTVLSISRQGIEKGTACVCDNCGAVIVNNARIKDEKGNVYTVGLDCVKSLTKSIKNFSMLDESLYQFNLGLRFMTAYNKAHRIESDIFQTFAYYIDKKGNEVEAVCYTTLLKEFGFIA